ncbi:hypothetical protein CYMTET_17391 [Cymbomonas tetramitiformis]|uniref:Uncharacterized protein n=1 Tax=Cymbomonas tetramitiformis TaxID=36881 RepID=A0AAE0GA66_9CHLO|nr:hypothetical protein CYMTET_17391 [Cymbomonas tetramitiformis]
MTSTYRVSGAPKVHADKCGLRSVKTRASASSLVGAGWPLVCASCAIIVAYHIMEEANPKTWRKTMEAARIIWTRKVLRKKDYILAVQTIRNGLMAATFFCSMTIALLTAALGALFEGSGSSTALSMAPEPLFSPATALQLPYIKLALLATVLAISSAAFAQACRYLMHASFIFLVVADDPAIEEPSQTELKNEQSPLTVPTGSAERLMVIAERWWWGGLRGMYITLPLITWMASGTVGFLVASVLLVWILSILDKPLTNTVA